jgi:hypothetical protein
MTEQGDDDQTADDDVDFGSPEHMATFADRVRTPLLPDEALIGALEDSAWNEDGNLTRPLTAREQADVQARRGALMLAALVIMDEVFDDLETVGFDPDEDDPDDLDSTFIYQAFPPRFRAAYDGLFARKVTVSVAKILGDLGSPNSDYPACTAEEIITYTIIQRAYEYMLDADLLDEPTELDLEGYLLQDTDFRMVFWSQMDGIENDAASQEALGMFVPSVADWFTPIGPERYPHPYAETSRTQPRTNTLPLPRTDAEEAAQHNPDIIDAPTPVAGLAAISEIVELARADARRTHQPDTWIPDENDPDSSVQTLIGLMESTKGSGHLAWEPNAASGTIRTDGTVAGTAHRHFPDPDAPFLAVSTGRGYLNVPLSAVVSWRPDMLVREEWSMHFSNMLGDGAED